MRIDSVKIRNFGPYYGEQELRFGEGRPIVLVHGENMRGKTSLLNSVRWALYGHALDRFGQSMALKDLVNWDAAASGDWTMSVELTFQVDSASFDLIRRVQTRDVSATPRDERDFVQHLRLERDHTLVESSEIQVVINRLLPEQISRFFLFDGELLNEYETLLTNYDSHAQTVKESIESILGVPALQNTVSDIRQNLKDARRRQRSLANQDRDAQVLSFRAAQLQAQIEADERDLARLSEQRVELTRQQRELDDLLKGTASVETEVEKLHYLRDAIEALSSEEEQLLEEKREALADSWQDLLQLPIQRRLYMLQKERDRYLGAARRVGELQTELAYLEKLGEARSCPVCNQPLAHEHTEDTSAEKRRIEAELTHLDFDENRVAQLSQSTARLQRVRGSGATDAVKQIERRLRATRVNFEDLNRQREEVEDRLKQHDEVAIARNRRDYDKVTKDLGMLEHRIREKEEAIAGSQLEAARHHAEISRVSGPKLDRVNREVHVYEELERLFLRGIETMRDDLRKSVENDASEIFAALTTDKSYSGLRINDYYGLVILDANGNEVQVRSAGAEQVVALSLIGSLNRNAVRRGPIIMDTPFGRLDPTHRENILRFLPTLADQVTLLVHSGEVDRDRDLGHVSDKIDREYEITYVTSSRSELSPLHPGR